MIEFDESGMHFRFDDGNCFQIENDSLVKGGGCDNSTSNNRACECVSCLDGKHYFIEAKSSTPQKGNAGNVKDLCLPDPENPGEFKPMPRNWEAYNNFQSFLRAVSKKFIDSFHILKAIDEERHGKERKNQIALPTTKVNCDKVSFVLIVNYQLKDGQMVNKDGVAQLMSALQNEMRPFLNIWNIPPLSVKVVLPDDAANRLHIPLAMNN